MHNLCTTCTTPPQRNESLNHYYSSHPKGGSSIRDSDYAENVAFFSPPVEEDEELLEKGLKKPDYDEGGDKEVRLSASKS